MADASKVDLNHAGVEELKAIKGVGKGRAEQIVLFRKARGAFNSVDELDQVPHVGNMPPAELAEVKRQVVVRTTGGR
jgi:competence ComEA-like helix-hairpin-helix protein